MKILFPFLSVMNLSKRQVFFHFQKLESGRYIKVSLRILFKMFIFNCT